MKGENISIVLEDSAILKAINFSWEKGETIALLGANGAGKSTLLNVISTVLKPTAGKLTFPDGHSSHEWRKMVGTVFQETFLYDELTAKENLDFYQRLYGSINPAKIEYQLKQVQLNKVRNDLCGAFSKGMKQRLSIARALLHEPTYLLLDEPFDGLDIESKLIIESLLWAKKSKGVGWMLVTHNVEEAWRLCDRAILIHNGKIIYESKCEESTYQPFMKEYQNVLQGNYHEVF